MIAGEISPRLCDDHTYMAAFHVFVEGPTDDTPAGLARLAEAIGAHYGLAPADLLARLRKGRFRVKTNTDRATAEQYYRDLERLGARCTIEEAGAHNSQRSTPLPFPAVRPATPPAGLAVAPSRPSAPPSALAGLAPSRPSAPPSALAGLAPSRPATPPAGAPQYQSGLAAAFSGESPSASLGALEQDGSAFSLGSVDGADDRHPEGAAAFAPAAGALSASIGPAPETAKPTDAPATPKDAPGTPKDVPLDLFAPPDAQDAELKVDIAADELETSKLRASTPVPADEPAPRTSSTQLARAEQPPARRSQPSLAAAAADVVARPSKLGPLGDVRVRFVAGVVLAIVIGFVPAHLVGAMRESSYKAIDDKVMAVQQLAETPEAYAALDTMRADQLARKQGEQRNTTIIALAIWALVGGAVAFGWFEKVPWERFE